MQHYLYAAHHLQAMKTTIKISTIRAFFCALIFSIGLGYLAGFQILGQSRDYENYLIYFAFAKESSWLDILSYRFEPGFATLTYILVSLQLSGAAVYGIIAGASIFLKFVALRTTAHFWLSLAVLAFYVVARYFTLFELTVLRAGVALSIAFFVFYSRAAHEYRATHLILLLVAVSMHYSAIAFIPIYLVRPSTRSVVLTLTAATFFTILAAKNAALTILPSYLPVLATYGEFSKATILPMPFAVDIAFLLFVLRHWDKNDALMKTCALGMAISVAFHFTLLEYSVVASRFRELLSVFYLLYVVRAMGYARNEVKYATIGYTVVSATLHLYAVHFHDPLLT